MTFSSGITVVTYLAWSILARAIQSAPKPSDDHLSRRDQNIAHFWGQYSPYFAIDSSISEDVPSNCEITFAQVLSRHGARDPTASKQGDYRNLTQTLKANRTFTGKYAFLNTYNFSLGADQLTGFGAQQMRDSGSQFFHRYESLAYDHDPFIRASSQQRVVDSAGNWTLGFTGNISVLPILIVNDNSNSTLSHKTCPNYLSGPPSNTGDAAQAEFASRFVPDIQRRLNSDLSGANLSLSQVISFMDLCPFETVASKNGVTISPFCNLLSGSEWDAYNYYQTIGKYYGYGNGNALGPTQGVGYVNELIARLTNSPVKDATNTNRTLDSDPATFPLGRKLYADFSHDNEMTQIFSALGLYNQTKRLSNTTVVEAESRDGAGYSATWTVAFAARAYFEKMQCGGSKEELVRIIVNDRVIPLQNCGADAHGRCTLSAFVQSQSFARNGGLWSQCYNQTKGV